MMKRKFIQAYLKVAEVFAGLSTAKRLQVGCVAVKNGTLIGEGYNGTPSGWSNDCESVINGELKTLPETIHAESNCLIKIARSTNSSEGADLFVTHAPCIDCAKLIYQAGVKSVYYRNQYRSDDGIDFLKKCNIYVEKIDG